jgi:hypothetical protein
MTRPLPVYCLDRRRDGTDPPSPFPPPVSHFPKTVLQHPLPDCVYDRQQDDTQRSLRKVHVMRARQILGILLAVMAVSATSAQSQNRGANMAQRYQALTDSLVVKMELSGELEASVRAIMATQQEGLTEIFESYSGQRSPEMREEVGALQEETEDTLVLVFTKEQMAEYRAIRDDWRAQIRQGRPPPPQG